MDKLSSRLDNVILVKREDRQPVHSFKLRGAYAMMSSLTAEQKSHGVITASAGNHAQGVAFSASRLGVKALIVMPVATADIKVDAVRGFGGEVLLHGANFDEAKARAIELAQQQGFTWVPPFDHPMVIAGQGTLALELLQQDAHIDRVFVPVGGGGLAAGVAVLIKQLMPQIKVIAVEAGRFCLPGRRRWTQAIRWICRASACLPKAWRSNASAMKRSVYARSIWTISSPSIAMLSARR